MLFSFLYGRFTHFFLNVFDEFFNAIIQVLT